MYWSGAKWPCDHVGHGTNDDEKAHNTKFFVVFSKKKNLECCCIHRRYHVICPLILWVMYLASRVSATPGYLLFDWCTPPPSPPHRHVDVHYSVRKYLRKLSLFEVSINSFYYTNFFSRLLFSIWENNYSACLVGKAFDCIQRGRYGFGLHESQEYRYRFGLDVS